MTRPMLAVAVPTMTDEECVCFDARHAHRGNGRFGCRNCPCTGFFPASRRAERERVLRAVIDVCERHAADARDELEALAARQRAAAANDELASLEAKATGRRLPATTEVAAAPEPAPPPPPVPPEPPPPAPQAPPPPNPEPETKEPTAMDPITDTSDPLLTPSEVARLFRVDPKTVTRWAADGRVPSIRTPGGHRRFWVSAIRALLLEDQGITDDSTAVA